MLLALLIWLFLVFPTFVHHRLSPSLPFPTFGSCPEHRAISPLQSWNALLLHAIAFPMLLAGSVGQSGEGGCPPPTCGQATFSRRGWAGASVLECISGDPLTALESGGLLVCAKELFGAKVSTCKVCFLFWETMLREVLFGQSGWNLH